MVAVMVTTKTVAVAVVVVASVTIVSPIAGIAPVAIRAVSFTPLVRVTVVVAHTIIFHGIIVDGIDFFTGAFAFSVFAGRLLGKLLGFLRRRQAARVASRRPYTAVARRDASYGSALVT